MGDSGAVASPDRSGESGGTGDARAAAEDVAALSSEGESGVVGRSTASAKSCVLVWTFLHLVPNHIPLASLPIQNEDIIQVNPTRWGMFYLSMPVFTLFLGETSGLGRRGAKGDCGVAVAF